MYFPNNQFGVAAAGSVLDNQLAYDTYLNCIHGSSDFLQCLIVGPRVFRPIRRTTGWWDNYGNITPRILPANFASALMPCSI